MLKNIFKKYWIFIFIFFCADIYLFIYQINEASIYPYLNLFIYFLLFIVVRETIPKTELDKSLVYLFYFLYAYLSLGSYIPILFRHIESWNWFFYTYTDIAKTLFIIFISIYLALFSYHKWLNKNYKLLYSLILGCIVIGFNYSQFISDPLALSEDNIWTLYYVRNYGTMSFSIIALVIFWIRYYKKYFVVTEYLNLVIFLFTLSNLSEVLYFLAGQHEFVIFMDSQLLHLILNTIMLAVWSMRLSYLHKEISLENERFLKNFQYLDGLISKPKKSFLIGLFFSPSIAFVFGSIIIILLLILTLYFINQITFYLFINTIFILIAVILAIYYSLSSIKRDWHNQIGFLFKEKAQK